LYSVEGRVAVGKSCFHRSLSADAVTVTGGGTGLGLVTATALAENGCRVYITGRRLEPITEAAKFKPRKGNGCIVAVQADLSNKDGILSTLLILDGSRLTPP
jgi:NAD(P)-dependent dehydrogenase (short-subunit alcohol dehydrogenase family)